MKLKAKPCLVACSFLRDEIGKLVFIGKGSFKRIEKYLNLNPKPVVLLLLFGSQKNVEDFKNKLRRSIGAHN